MPLDGREDIAIPFNGSGVYSLPSTTVTPAVTGSTIDSSDFNSFTADIETALTNCVTKDGQTANPVLDSPKVDEILDTNGNESIVLGATSSAVNALKVINAATGNVPTIQTHGEADIGLDFENSEGEEILQLVATPTAVNNVVITNATTGNAATISTSETNTNLNLTGNGTGTVTIGGTTVITQGSSITSYGAQATTSGTTIDFTSIPSWVKRITLTLIGVSTDAQSEFKVLLGSSGTPQTTGYISQTVRIIGGASPALGADTTFFSIGSASNPADTLNGTAIFTHHSGNTWTIGSNTHFKSSIQSRNDMCSGYVALSGTLDILQLTTVAGDTFDAGAANILYEG